MDSTLFILSVSSPYSINILGELAALSPLVCYYDPIFERVLSSAPSLRNQSEVLPNTELPSLASLQHPGKHTVILLPPERSATFLTSYELPPTVNLDNVLIEVNSTAAPKFSELSKSCALETSSRLYQSVKLIRSEVSMKYSIKQVNEAFTGICRKLSQFYASARPVGLRQRTQKLEQRIDSMTHQLDKLESIALNAKTMMVARIEQEPLPVFEEDSLTLKVYLSESNANLVLDLWNHSSFTYSKLFVQEQHSNKIFGVIEQVEPHKQFEVLVNSPAEQLRAHKRCKFFLVFCGQKVSNFAELGTVELWVDPESRDIAIKNNNCWKERVELCVEANHVELFREPLKLMPFGVSKLPGAVINTLKATKVQVSVKLDDELVSNIITIHLEYSSLYKNHFSNTSFLF